MPGGISLDTITRGLMVAQRIKEMHGAGCREDSDASLKPDKMSLLKDALQIVTQLVPDEKGGRLSHAISRSTHFSSAYREMKGHLREYKGKRKPGSEQIMKTLKVVKPVLDTRQTVYLDKIIKIIEILNS